MISLALTLEQVDELYDSVNKAWKSMDFRPRLSYRAASNAGFKADEKDKGEQIDGGDVTHSE